MTPTIEQMIKFLDQSLNPISKSYYEAYHPAAIGFIEAIRAELLKRKWLPIENYDGKDNVGVLLWKSGWAEPSVGFKSEGVWLYDEFEDEIHPTHWQPLPESPKR